jgi:hypothetical protein
MGISFVKYLTESYPEDTINSGKMQ